LDDEVMRFLEQLAVDGGIAVVEELFRSRPAHPASDDSTA